MSDIRLEIATWVVGASDVTLTSVAGPSSYRSASFFNTETTTLEVQMGVTSSNAMERKIYLYDNVPVNSLAENYAAGSYTQIIKIPRPIKNTRHLEQDKLQMNIENVNAIIFKRVPITVERYYEFK